MAAQRSCFRKLLGLSNSVSKPCLSVYFCSFEDLGIDGDIYIYIYIYTYIYIYVYIYIWSYNVLHSRFIHVDT